MKRMLLLLVLAIFLGGCATIYETDSPKISANKRFNLTLKLDGFQLISLQHTGTDFGSANATAYNWNTNTTVTATGSAVVQHYGYRPDPNFNDFVVDSLEGMGFNLRGGNPDYVLYGRVGSGRFPWNEASFYYCEAPTFLFAIVTFGVALSCARENDVSLLVYDRSGARVAKYTKKQFYRSFSIGVPFAYLANDKAFEWYGDRKAAEFAFLDCLNMFIRDLENGTLEMRKDVEEKRSQNGSSEAR